MYYNLKQVIQAPTPFVLRTGDALKRKRNGVNQARTTQRKHKRIINPTANAKGVMFICVTVLHRRIRPTKSNRNGVTAKRNNPLQ
jgi:hypothetical protein